MAIDVYRSVEINEGVVLGGIKYKVVNVIDNSANGYFEATYVAYDRKGNINC